MGYPLKLKLTGNGLLVIDQAIGLMSIVFANGPGNCSTVAKIIQHFIRAGSTQNRSQVGCPKKLSAHAECHIQMLSLKDQRRSAVSMTERLKRWGVSLLVLRLYAALYIKLVCMAVRLGGILFWRQYIRKPASSLLKTCQQSTRITGTMSSGLMR